MKSILFFYLFLFITLWILLLGSLSVNILVSGLILAVIMSRVLIKIIDRYMSGFVPFTNDKQLFRAYLAVPRMIVMLLLFIPYFVFEIMASAMRISFLVFRPKKVNPAIILYHPSLNNPFLTAILANLITLTPGTMTVDCDKHSGALYVHCLQLHDDAQRERIRVSISKLESWVRRIFA